MTCLFLTFTGPWELTNKFKCTLSSFNHLCCEEAISKLRVSTSRVFRAYAALPSAIRHLLLVNVCVWCRLCRLPRDPAAADDRPAEVPPGEAGGAEGLLPAA